MGNPKTAQLDRIYHAAGGLARLLSLGLIAAATAACAPPGFQSLAVDPVGPTPFSAFAGSGRDVAVQFENHTGRDDVDVFPEPPLRITQVKTKEACEIDSGVWVRRSVHLSKDEKHLLLQEFSGSSDNLVLYSTSTCTELQRIDISEARWEIHDSRLAVGSTCTGDNLSDCSSQKRYRFDGNLFLPDGGSGND